MVKAGACTSALYTLPGLLLQQDIYARRERDLARVRSEGNGCSRSLVFYTEECYIGGTMEVAVIKTGGKQYVVAKGDTIAIEKLPGDLKKGDTVVFGEVLLVDNGSGTTPRGPINKRAGGKGTAVSPRVDKKKEGG